MLRRQITLARMLAGVLALAPAAAQAGAPTFSNYVGPTSLASNAGEPSIGYNPHTDTTLFQSSHLTLKVTGFDGAGQATWTDVTEPSGALTLDPILWTDRDTGRTISSQLMLACSKAAITDDDGATWLPSQGCGIGTAIDHQSVGGGPFAGDLHDDNPLYRNAVYYCTQTFVTALCATSFDGGITFGPARPIYTDSQCNLMVHGHVKVGPDGTVYVPNADCHGHPALAVSTDNGLSWTVDEVTAGTTQGEPDPHLGIGAKGTLYFGFQGGDGEDLGDKYQNGNPARTEGRAWIAVKPAGSSEWRPPIDVGAPLGIKNIQFAEVFAGDDDRAAYAFLGTTTAGDDQDPNFKGVWHLYVAFTYDAGRTWTTVDATPTDPVQRGCIIRRAPDEANCHNLLDFNDITIDKDGRVMVAYSDGCTDACVTADPASYDYRKVRTSLGVIARQESGRGLYAAADAKLANAPAVEPARFSRHVNAPPATRTGHDSVLLAPFAPKP